jgi:hypothetical protein
MLAQPDGRLVAGGRQGGRIATTADDVVRAGLKLLQHSEAELEELMRLIDAPDRRGQCG